MQNLQKNTHYINSGNSFSQSYLIGNNFKKEKKLIIFDNDEKLLNFSKIYSFLIKDEDIFELKDEFSYMSFLNAKSGTFLVNYDLFYSEFPSEYEISKNSLCLKKGENSKIEEVIKKLVDFSYKYSDFLVEGSYKKDGDILSIKPFSSKNFYKISFFGDEVEEILEVDENFKIIGGENELIFFNANKSSDFLSQKRKENINADFLKNINCLTFVIELDFVDDFKIFIENLKNKIVFKSIEDGGETDLGIFTPKIDSLEELKDFLGRKNSEARSKNVIPIPLSGKESIVASILDPSTIARDDKEMIARDDKNEKQQIINIYTKNHKTLSNFIEYNSFVRINLFDTNLKLESFCLENEYFICDDILGEIFVKKRVRRSVSSNIDLLLQIKPGDYITHINHGVGIFNQIILKEISSIKREYVELEYSEHDKLFVPISELHRLSKYIGQENPKLTRLNTNEWSRILKKADEEVEKIAQELLEIYAKRKIIKGFPFLPFSSQEKEFTQAFKYDHTADQQSSIFEILDDMNKEDPMDRLLVGDVGFGKTEVAMNAIYRAFLNKKQTCFISPLVVLAYEHFETLQDRLGSFGVKVEILTRFSTSREENLVLSKLQNGEIDCVIGTHKLLGESIIFKNLGLLIIDEEHRFGVKDKEKINAMKSNLDILSISATPIPRSLNFALNGIKQISIISTPPPSKKPIKTFLKEFSWETIKDAVLSEIERGGQIIFINNRISFLEIIKKNLAQIIGDKAKIVITHGQMDGTELEDRIIDFKKGKFNILISTTVVENGVNFLNANTVIINDAQNFGISSLHQLRGRVGRKDVEGHCFLLYDKDKTNEEGKKRLSVIVNNSYLGAGFELALRDLEIRGAGDILGVRQSGKAQEVGITIFLKLLEEKINELKTGEKKKETEIRIELDISYYIENDFFGSEEDKIHFFRNLENIENEEDLDYAYRTFVESNDLVPEELENLFLVLKSKLSLKHYKVASVRKVLKNYFIEFDKNEMKLELLKEFLRIFDKKKDFVIITPFKISVETQLFKNDKEFLKIFV
ncbi:MAG: CarD family transcriptional regulator [Candidatus Gracilibacteria bacterium]|nr:CarD family transcriptional regulator [Candidatus Gracilibacteria bacterium]